MEVLTESFTNRTLWPYGHDKRMLFAIYAHINTIVQQQDTLNVPGPVFLKLKTICSTLLSMLQILTGMTVKEMKLDFELSSMFESLDKSIKQSNPQKLLIPSIDFNAQRCGRSQTISTVKSKGKKRKKKRKRRNSQHAVIYDVRNGASDGPLNLNIIEDYKSDSNATVSYRDASKYSPISMENASPCSLWKAPPLSPLTYRCDYNLDRDADSESFSAAESSLNLNDLVRSHTVSTFGNDVTSCLAASVSSIRSLSNSRTQNLRDSYKIEAVDSDIEIELDIEGIAERRNTLFLRKEQRPRGRSKARLWNDREADLVDRCRSHCGTGNTVTVDGVFMEMEMGMELEREARTTEGEENSNSNSSGRRPPLPQKANKSVALEVVNKSWRERRQRPLPKPNPL